MPYLDAVPLPLPFTGRTPRSRQASLGGARAATVMAGSQASRMLVWYALCDRLSDSEMALRLGLPEARISARRAGLMVKGLVAYEDTVTGRHGAPNSRWRLTLYGQRVARLVGGDGMAEVIPEHVQLTKGGLEIER